MTIPSHWQAWHENYNTWFNTYLNPSTATQPYQQNNLNAQFNPSPEFTNMRMANNQRSASSNAAGQVAVSPQGTNPGVSQQAKEQIAKRTGRTLASSGVSSVPSLTRVSRYRSGYM